MLALARGGACHGMAYRLRPDDLHGQLLRLLDREVGSARGLSAVRWVKCRCASEEFRALAFYVQNGDDMFVHLPIEEQARRLARAAGQWGSGATYLHNTIVQLEELGIHDSYLWRLQRLVAAEIAAMPPLAASYSQT
jgi:cation transport protein ChaC